MLTKLRMIFNLWLLNLDRISPGIGYVRIHHVTDSRIRLAYYSLVATKMAGSSISSNVINSQDLFYHYFLFNFGMTLELVREFLNWL